MPEAQPSKPERWKSAEEIMYNILVTLSMEYRTPITVVKGYSDLLLTESVGPLNKKQTKMVTNINQISSDLLESINQLLVTQQASIGVIQLELEVVNIKQLVPIYPDYFALDIPDTLPPIEADKQYLQMVFKDLVNEIINRCEISGNKSATFKATMQNKNLIIRISAKGKNLTYFGDEQANPTLFVSNAVIEQHGGHFDIKKSDDTLEFIITLPVAPQTS